MSAPEPADPAQVTNEQLSVDLCGPEDRAEQARLFNACFKKSLAADALSWRYDQSPHGRSVSIVARPPSGDAICGYACSPRQALVRGDEATLAPVGQTGDVMTHPDWRKRGIFSGLDARCMEETARREWPAVFGLPNRRSAHIFLKLGWDQVGTLRPWTFYFRSDAAGRALRAREGRLRALALPLARLRCAGQRRRLERGARGYPVRPLERFPEEVRGLAAEVEARFDFMVRRDADYLNWRFIDTTTRLHSALGVYDAEDALVGYAVVQRPGDDGVGFLVDLLAPDPAVQAAAVTGALELLDEAGALAVQATAIDGSYWSSVLQEAGFLAPKPENHLIVIRYLHDREHALAEPTSDASRWYVTDGDRDDESMG